MQVLETSCILCAALAVALLFPTYAEKIFAVTGCTAVCLVCYVIPVWIHLTVLTRARAAELDADVDAAEAAAAASALLEGSRDREEGGEGCQEGEGGEGGGLCAPLLLPQAELGFQGQGQRGPKDPSVGAGRSWLSCLSWGELALPCLVVAVGVGCSVAGLWVAMLDIMGPRS